MAWKRFPGTLTRWLGPVAILGVILAGCSGRAAPANTGPTASVASDGKLGMCALLTGADLRAVGLAPELDPPTANVQDGGQSAWCDYSDAIEFDIFVSDDPVAVQKTIFAEADNETTEPAGLTGADASFIGPPATSGGPSNIVVRKGKMVFELSIPPGAQARDQLLSVARTVLKRLPG